MSGWGGYGRGVPSRRRFFFRNQNWCNFKQVYSYQVFLLWIQAHSLYVHIRRFYSAYNQFTKQISTTYHSHLALQLVRPWLPLHPSIYYGCKSRRSGILATQHLCSFDLELPTQIRVTLKIFAKRFNCFSSFTIGISTILIDSCFV